MGDFAGQFIAAIDVETTGLDPSIHEIIEIGLVIYSPQLDTQFYEKNLKVFPTKSSVTYDQRALEINGYARDVWEHEGALSLNTAMGYLSSLTAGAILLAHNMVFDYSFLREAYKQTGVKDLTDYHRLDLFSIAYTVLEADTIQQFRLASLAKHFGLEPEPMPHRAINGAKLALEVFKKLMRLTKEKKHEI